MNRPFLLLAIAALSMVECAAIQAPAPQIVDLTTWDGSKLKATYFAAGSPGPGVLLLHQCNRDRKMWENLAPRLAASGVNVLALDFRGYGDSSGTAPYKLSPQEGQRQLTEVWPRDVDAAFEYLLSQSGVSKDVIGAGGASCGVNQSIQLARRHPQVKSLVLLSGSTNRDGRQFLRLSPQLPIFASAADDDQGAVEILQWLLGLSRNGENRFQHYASGGHGIEMFAPHPELAEMIVGWFSTTLLKTPGRAVVTQAAASPETSILETLDQPGGTLRAAAMLAQTGKRDPGVTLFPESIVNLIGYEYLQAGDNKSAIEVFKLNVLAFPSSPNAYDSLAEAFIADGQSGLGMQNAQKALALLQSDTTDSEARRKLIRESAEEKLKQLQPASH